MKQLVFIAVLMTMVISVGAQTRKQPVKRPAVTPKTAATGTVPQATAAAIAVGAGKVSTQIKNVSKFIYALGGIAQGIEAIDKDTRANKAARDANDANKGKVMQSIRNVRAGLASLEVEFRTNANLRKFLPHLQGITDLSAESEDLATAGQFSAAGKPLLLVVERLADTLAAMP